VTDTIRTETANAGHEIKRVSVSISVPDSYFVKVWRESNPVAEGEEPPTPVPMDLEKIRTEKVAEFQKAVAILLPEVPGLADKTELVTVTTFPDITPEAIPEPSTGENAMAWFAQYWTTVGMIGLALFSLVMLRSMVKVAPPGETSEAKRDAAPAPGDEDESPEKAAMRQIGRFSGSGPSLRDELADLVQEDPDSAANILRTWIGSPG
jgi:flagellar M-ring protein FliF